VSDASAAIDVIGAHNGAGEFLHQVVGFVAGPREEPVVMMASGPYCVFIARQLFAT
jgi:hypothetical protein